MGRLSLLCDCEGQVRGLDAGWGWKGDLEESRREEEMGMGKMGSFRSWLTSYQSSLKV